ncbi:MAG: outer membrane protein assembly factor BamB [Halomonadaceae bacterium]|nr:MAG: outer membrane protein assembly factor BamB [Halomonadaceae bacterium]
MALNRRSQTLLWLVVVMLLVSGCNSSPSDSFERAADAPEGSGEVQVRKIWSQRVARGHDGQFLFLRPVVEGDRVFVATADGYITAYNARNGRRDWWVRVEDERLLGGVGSDSERLYVTTRSGKLIALSPEDGEELWRSAMPNEVLAPPQSNGQLVVVQTIDSGLIAFDSATGNQRWQYDSNAPVLSYRGTATPYIDANLVVTGFDNGRVIALDVVAGRELWQYGVGSPSGRTELERLVDVDGSPVVHNSEVYVTGYQGRVAALDLMSGAEQWSRPLSSLQSPAVHNGRVYTTTSDGQMIGFSRTDRTELWRHNHLEWRRLTSPVILGDHLLVGDFEGYLYAINQADGRIEGRALVDEKGLRSDMVRYRDRVILFGNGGQLASYRIVEN